MRAELYRRRAFEAQREAAQAPDETIKSRLDLLAQEWLALADQVEWLEQRYGPSIAADFESHVVSQQQHVRPEDEKK
jgi:hypothetical protein